MVWGGGVKRSDMNLPLKSISVVSNIEDISKITLDEKQLINCINAHSFNIAQTDKKFAEALKKSDVLLADGSGILLALKLFGKGAKQRVTGWDIFIAGMERLNKRGGKAFFLGSTEVTLEKIKKRAEKEFSNISIQCFSPKFAKQFNEEQNVEMLEKINGFNPDILWVGLGSPKQELWAFENYDKLNVNGWVAAIGAVFDFYARTIKRAPIFLQRCYLEWMYRFLQEPCRLWRRYLIGNVNFVWNVWRGM